MTRWSLPELMTVWRAGASDGVGGFTYTRSDNVSSRWANKVDKVVGENGTEYVTNFRVYTDYDLRLGDHVYKGSSSSLTPIQEAQEVRATSKIPTSTTLIMAVA